MPVIDVRLLGGIDVRVDGETVSGLADTRTGFLLGYLLVERDRRLQRTELAMLLWPDADRGVARNNLRQMLHHLRQRLGPAVVAERLITTRETVSLTLLQDDRLDLEELERVDAYAGPLLGRHIEPVVSVKALNWLVQQRRNIQSQVIAHLQRQVDRHLDNGAVSDATVLIDRFIVREPFSEAAYRLLMRTLANAGYRSEAIEQYQHLEQQLSHNLSVQPMAETRALRDVIASATHTVESSDSGNEISLPSEIRFVAVACVTLTTSPTHALELQSDRLTATRRRILSTFEQNRGHVVVGHGGMLFAYFGYPAAFERIASRAACAALAVVGVEDGDVLVSGGIAAGNMVTGDDPALPDPIGSLSQRALLLSERAGGGEVLAEPSVYRALDARFKERDKGIYVRGKPACLIETVASVRPAQSDRPLIGRDSQRDCLKAAWNAAYRGDSKTIFVRGDAGMGKTRLVSAISDVATHNGARVFSLQATPERRQRAFGSVIDFIARLVRDECDTEALSSLNDYLTRCTGSSGAADVIAGLIGRKDLAQTLDNPDPHLAHDLIRAAINDLFRGLAQQPVVFVYEDLHWADDSGIEWLRNMLSVVTGYPVLLIGTARSGTPCPWPAQAAQVIDLPPLDPSAADRLFQHLQQGHQLSASVRDRVVARANGNPLYLEGLAHLAVSDAEAVALPATVQELLLTRLEQLGGARALAEAAAALGETFDRPALDAAMGDEIEEPDRALQQLVDDGLLLMTDCEPEIGWTHILYREVAYAAMAESRTHKLHRRIADYLITLEGSARAVSPETIAHHLEHCDRLTLAARFRVNAGEGALLTGATNAGVFNFEQALKDLRGSCETDEVTIDAHVGLGMTYLVIQGYGSPSVDRAFRSALSLPRARCDPSRYGRILWGLWMCASSLHGFDEAKRLASEMQTLADHNHDHGMVIGAHAAHCINELFAGSVDAAIHHGRTVQTLYSAGDHYALAMRFGDDPGLTNAVILAWALWLAGDVDSALDLLDTTATAAEPTGHAPTCGFVHSLTGVIAQRAGDPDRAAASAAKVLGHDSHSRYPLWSAAATALDAWSRAVRGETGAVRVIESTVAGIDQVMESASTVFRLFLADAQRHAGWLDSAWATTETALGTIERVGDTGLRPDFWIQQGRLAAAAGEASLARSVLTRADAAAKARGALMQCLEIAMVRATLPDATSAERAAVAEWREHLSGARLPSAPV